MPFLWMLEQGKEYAAIGRYPYMVSLVNPSTNVRTCGRILYSPQWIVTLAACVDNSTFNNPPNPKVVVHDLVLNDMDTGEEVSPVL